MARPVRLKDAKVISTRLEAGFYELLKDIAAFETIATGKLVSCQDLIRMALRFVFADNERLRECFVRSRKVASKKR